MGMKFKFQKFKDEYNQYDNSDVTVEVETVMMSEVLEEFSRFLNAVGYNTDELDKFIEGEYEF